MTRTLAALLLSSLAGLAAVGPAAADVPGAPAAPVTPAAKRAGKVPYRVLKVMPATQQAVVLDREHNTQVQVEIGDNLGDFQVIDVDEDEVVLWRDGREVVLPFDPAAIAPPASPAPGATPRPTGGAPSLLDPYGSSGLVSAPGPLDPYASAAPPRVVSATNPGSPLDPYATVVSATAPATPGAAPVVSATAPAGPAIPGAPHEVLAPPDQRASLQGAEVLDPYAEPKVVPAPAGAEPIKGVPAPQSEAARALEIRAEPLPVQRAQLVAAVASFDKLAKDHGFVRTGRGVRITRVDVDSYAYGLGLRAGDLITAIDGAPLRGLDDAAAAYVGLDTAAQLRLDIERGSARGTLRFTLK